MFQPSYYPNYFSIEDIMTTQETVTCTTETTFLNLGFLIAGNETADISRNTQLELPFWLAKRLILAEQQRGVMQVLIRAHVPKVFSERSRNIFEADAKVVNLYRVNAHFYEFGHALSRLQIRENELIHEIITKAFKERFRIIMDWADNVMADPTKIQTLDITERELFRLGHKSRALLDAWLVEGVPQMQATDLVVNLRKRKLMEDS